MVATMITAVLMAWVATGFCLWGLTLIFGGFNDGIRDAPFFTICLSLTVCGTVWPYVLYKLAVDRWDLQ